MSLWGEPWMNVGHSGRRLSRGLKETQGGLGTLGEAFPGQGNSKYSGLEQEPWLLQGSVLDRGWWAQGAGSSRDPGGQGLVFCM